MDIKNDILDCKIHKYTNTQTQHITVPGIHVLYFWRKANRPRTSNMIFWNVKYTNTNDIPSVASAPIKDAIWGAILGVITLYQQQHHAIIGTRARKKTSLFLTPNRYVMISIRRFCKILISISRFCKISISIMIFWKILILILLRNIGKISICTE